MLRSIRYPILFLLVLYQLLLAGCTVAPVKDPAPKQETPEQSLSRLYQLAQNSRSPDTEGYLLEAATVLISLKRNDEAETILSGIATERLPEQLKTTHSIARSQVALSFYKAQEALDILAGIRALTSPKDIDLIQQLALLRAQSYRILNRPIASAQQLVSIEQLIQEPNSAAHQELIWDTLMQGTVSQLSAAVSDQDKSSFNGWLQLALLSKDNQNNLDKELAALNQWRKAWPNHAAARRLPEELQLLSTIISERPKHITLLLPLNGKNGSVGRAIRDGFLAAYYDALEQQSQTPKIDIIDTSTTINFLELYNQASMQGSELIIGPLQKENVRLLASLPELKLPTLALNYHETAATITNLFQFGLSAEDEAKQVARAARRKGFQRSLVLTPNSDWGKRIARAFATEWSAVDGKLLETQYFGEENDYSNAIKGLLNLDESERRAQRVQSLTAQKLEFTPQRRSDMDFIFVVAAPKQARQIKPTLAFHFAGKVPVYATSHIFSGTSSPLLDRDLEGITFCEIPWMLDYDNSSIKQRIGTTWPATAGHLGRLYALGVDSFHLFPRIKQLAMSPNGALDGATGKLTLDQQGRIVRQLSWAEIQDGQIRAQDHQ